MDQDLEKQLKEVIVESLMLEDVKPEEIDSEEALFVEGLGLDSIDALELAIAIDKKFGVRIKPDDEDTQKVFANVKSLAAYVAGRLAEN
ncbi:MAG: acyl carrier protein [Deltaproteobacteria bacterium]|jgi:acyl carrier protein|nr:acyl carrier protein [Deltaproteobacteria bacterium]